MVDTGAHCSVISRDILEIIGEHVLKSDKELLDASGNYMNVVGKVTLPVKVEGIKVKLVEFHVKICSGDT